MEKVTKSNIQQVSIRKIFREKNAKLAKLIPGFIYKYLERICHEDDVNHILKNFGMQHDYDFSNAMIKHFNVNINTEGLENLPTDGRYIFVSNHPLGGFDAHIIMKLVGDKYGKTSYRFLVNDILMSLKNMHGAFLPINKHGRQNTEAVQKLDDAFKSNVHIMTFPAGLVSRKHKGVVMDSVWHKSFIAKAKQYKRDVIPIYVSGGNTNFFYRLNKFRKAIGIKANIEMLYLIDETFKHKNKHFDIKFGEPISWETFDKTKKPIEWAKYVKEVSYTLGGVENVPY